MILDRQFYEKFQSELLGRDRLTHQQAMAIFESLWEEGRELGVLPQRDPLEGIETDLRLAAIINSCSKSCSLA